MARLREHSSRKARLIVSGFICFVLFQVCQATSTGTLKQLLDEQVKETLEELVQPLNTEVTRLNQTLVAIEKDLARRQLTNKNQYIFMNINTLKEEDSCRNLSDYLPKAQEIVENAFYMSSDVTAALTEVFLASADCFEYNILKTVPCLLKNVGEIRNIYNKYKPEIVPIMLQLKDSLGTVFELYEDCIRDV